MIFANKSWVVSSKKLFINMFNWKKLSLSSFYYKSKPVLLGRWDTKRRPAEILQERGYYW
jgi:hypothetical protein